MLVLLVCFQRFEVALSLAAARCGPTVVVVEVDEAGLAGTILKERALQNRARGRLLHVLCALLFRSVEMLAGRISRDSLDPVWTWLLM